MALDYVNGGAFIDIGGEEGKFDVPKNWSDLIFCFKVIPVYFHTHLVVSPDNQGYMTGT